MEATNFHERKQLTKKIGELEVSLVKKEDENRVLLKEKVELAMKLNITLEKNDIFDQKNRSLDDIIKEVDKVCLDQRGQIEQMKDQIV